MADKIQNAYESSKNIYDDVLTQRNFFSKMYIRIFWSGTDDNDIARKVLSYIPDDFSGNPDKQKAFNETWRVLKPGGNFIACFYIKGKSRRTDWLVKNILSKKGWFSPPFQTEEELRDILQKMYKEIHVHVDGSMVYFHCVK